MRVCAALFSLTLIGVAAAASAHVTVSSTDAKAGGFGKLVFRVPTESETASTTKVTVELPAKTPFAFVSSQVKPGWTVKLEEKPLFKPIKVEGFTVSKAVTSVTWTATGDGVAPGQFDEFALSIGPIPNVKSLAFAVQQGYSDESTANWDQIQSGKTEPEHPAPTLDLSTPAPTAEKSSDSSNQSIAIVALVLAAVGLALGLRNNRRNA
ncbi:MAG: YcnI family protein [Actinomycetota bacterium]|nr:YcnI family protein [Actinomycetota bacterium]